MTNSLFKAVEQLSTREGYYSSLIKAKIFKDIEKNFENLPLSKLVIEHKNGIWGKEYLEDGIQVKVLRSPDIRHGFIDIKNAEKRFISNIEYEKHKLVFGDILVIKSNGSQDLVGKSQVFDTDEENVIPSNFVMRLRPNLEIIDAYYLDLFLKSPQSLMWRFENQTTTTGLRNLKTKEYLATLIPLPSIEVQKYIVKFYERCIKGEFEKNSIFISDEYKKIYNIVNEYEMLNKNIIRQSEIIQHLKTSTIQDAVQGKLVEQNDNDEPASIFLEKIKQEKEKLIKQKKIKKEKLLPQITDEEKPFDLPNRWEWGRLGEVCNVITDGDHQAPPQTTNGINFLVISNVSNGTLSFENTRFVSKEYYDRLSELRKPKKGDILFTVTGSYGIPIIVDTDREFCFQRHIALLKPSLNIMMKYLYWVLTSDLVKKQCDEGATGTAQKTVSLTTLRNLKFPIPPLNEQIRIVEKVNQLMSLCNELEKNIEQSKQESERLMKAVLQEAFTVKEEVLN
ncbi:hypothetical protein CN947_18985 [Bacillus cereus]|nr:hypothetical protein CN947_18985 [Bacillus cereus]